MRAIEEEKDGGTEGKMKGKNIHSSIPRKHMVIL